MAFVINSLRGGQNDSDPPISLDNDQVVLAQNVEFHRSTLGERRRGAEAINLTGSPFTGCDRCVWLHRHLPTSDQADAQLWALCINDTGPQAVLAYKDTTWHTVTMPDAPTIDGVSEYQVNGVSLHGKLFIAYNSAVDRLHKWRSGASLERVGLSQPSAAPTAVDTAVAGSFTTTRYYRVRETVQDAGVTLVRSEPSEALEFAPNESFDGAIVTKPATTNSDPAVTHWELEASLDNANFYVIATTVIGTTSVTDTQSAGTGYAEFDLSEDIGDYIPPHSAKRLQADEDRLVLYSAWENAALESSMSWTPVYNATGVGNDERITLDPVSIINLDGYEGGAITDESSAIAGELWVFKEFHTYKVTRTGIRIRAYEGHTISKQRGAIPGSVVEGVDEAGNPSLYFIDAASGPARTVRGGIQTVGRDIWETFQTINLDASKVVCRGWYYPANRQIHWRIATGSSDIPVLGLCLQTNETRLTEGGEARRGFSIWTGDQCMALTAVLYSDNINDNVDRSHTLVPYIGLEDPTLIWQLDTGDDDEGTEYEARITTKPYAPTDLQTDFEIKTAKLVGKAVDDATVVVSAIPNFGSAETKVAGTVDFSPVDDAQNLTWFMDDLGMCGCEVVQFDFSDAATPGARWELARFTATITTGQGN